METFLKEFAQQGPGYLIATLEGFVIVWLFFRLDKKDKQVEQMQGKIDTLQDKRAEENKENTKDFVGLGKDLVNGMNGLKEAQQGFTRFIEKFQTVK